MKAIKIIFDSWEEAKPSCMNGVWRKIWPECVHRSAAEVDGTPAVCHEISNLARESNFESMEETDINELLTSHNQEFSNKELLQLELHFANEEDDSDRLIEISKEQNLTSKQISKAMCLIDEAMEIKENDPDSGRSLKVSQAKHLDEDFKLNNISNYLEGEAFSYYIEELQDIYNWGEIEQKLTSYFTIKDSNLFSRFLNLKYNDNDDLEQYFKEKSALAKKLNLDKSLLLEALTDGMPDHLKKYLIAARVQEPSDWYKITTQLKLSTNKEEEPQQPSTSTSTPVKRFNSNSSKAHQYQPFPRTAAATHHQQEPHKSMSQPPYPCKICASHQLPNQLHFHRDCPLKNNNHPKRINPGRTLLLFSVFINQISLPCVLDTASSISIIPLKYLNHIHYKILDNSPKERIGQVEGFSYPLYKILVRLSLDNIPIAQKPYRTSFYNNAEIQKQITELLKYDIIRPSSSPYSSPALLVNKKSDTPNHPTRLCIDYRKLNQKTVPEHTPIPLIEQIIDRLSQSKIYTILDVKNAYWHIPIDEKDRHKTSFVTQLGCYEWNRLPYGLKNAPSQFERIMKAPFNELLLKNAPWLWSAKHEQAFQTLKNSLISQPVLYIYDPSKPCHLFTDTSSLGVAGVLKQPDEQGISHPIGYFSRKLHPYEQNYTASEIETLAIINSVQRFHTYLHNIHFTLHTDHLPLKWFKNVKNPQGRLFRWSLILSQYSFDIKHIKGLNNIEADMLSRAPVSFYLTYNEFKEHQSTEQISSGKIKIQNGLYMINKKGFKRAYVPQTLRQKLLSKVHTKHGHIGTTQMTKIISPHYYWPHMTRDIANYTKHCETCQFNKSRDNRIVYGPLQQMPIATHPNHIFSLDTLGGLHNYGTTRHSIHMIVDHHSRFLWAFPTKSVSTDSYITCLRNLFQINKPEILITDRNAAFLSRKFKHFLERNNVKHLLTSSHHPETNAKVERLNSTIINRLRCEYNANLKIPWTKYIPKITESYNETVHTTTGFTPKFLYYGIQPQYIEHDTVTHTPFEKARKLAIERTIKSHEHIKQLYDIKHPEPIFKEGDQVLVKTFIYPNTGKLTQRYIGPFTILKQLSPVTYEINKPNLPQRKQTEIIHSNKLKLFYPETDFLLHYSTNIENDFIVNQNSNTKLIDINDKPCFLQDGHILDMDNEEQISAPILKPSQIT
ncbi:hypothetical protein LAZ67_12002130 [Cordylochernes scorpioides]|uniref:RNA-directed DNA polymerase n=1 Tax=Cordylochernes scorpioides TaxID=51811 RepID=A0ABY6L225_9ARAC|nr:hypothetical protein LAZ67_12002130 [Cordylochernes scorpioides]